MRKLLSTSLWPNLSFTRIPEPLVLTTSKALRIIRLRIADARNEAHQGSERLIHGLQRFHNQLLGHIPANLEGKRRIWARMTLWRAST